MNKSKMPEKMGPDHLDRRQGTSSSPAEARKSSRLRSSRLEAPEKPVSIPARAGLRRSADEVGIGKLKSGEKSRKKVGGAAARPEELVKYMSSLPSYLQRPQSGAESGGGQPLNVGVLDWGRLEKWKHEQRPVPARRNGNGSRRSSLAPTTAPSSSSSSSSMSASRARTAVSGKVGRPAPPNHHRESKESVNRDRARRKVRDLVVEKTKIADDDRLPEEWESCESAVGVDSVRSAATEGNRLSFADDLELKFGARPSDIAFSCPLPCEFQSSKWPDVDLSTPVGVQVNKTLSNRLQPPSPDPGTAMSQRPSDVTERDATPSKLEFCRLSRSLSSKEMSCTTRGMESPKAGYASDSCRKGKAKERGRSRQSPLRRLFDQVLKPKQQLRDEPTSQTDLKPRNSKTDQAVKTTLCCSEASSVNALLQVAYKDGIPLFTFTSTAGGGILIARRKKVFMSGKDDFEWVYTFYSAEETKKKGGARWMQQGRKEKKLETRVLGQMKVSTNPKSLYLAMEYELFGADLSEVGQEALDFLPNNQLAAIVMSLREEMHRCDSCCGGVCEVGGGNSHRKEVNGLGVTVILPTGVHGLPTEEGVPSPLIDRWRSGGACDCGGWDLGCSLSILDNLEQPDPSFFHAGFTSDDAPLLDLYTKVC